MLKKFTSDALGLSDIGKIIESKDFDKVDADDYIMHEDGEKIFFLIKSKTDEYCFTNIALIHVDGTSAVSKKRLVKRYPYYINSVENVYIETAGTVDLDCEIKFDLGNMSFSIDVDKKQLEQLKDLYKALIKIGEINRENSIMLGKANETLEMAAKVCQYNRGDSEDLAKSFRDINEYSFNWINDARVRYIQKDFTDIFKNYINN